MPGVSLPNIMGLLRHIGHSILFTLIALPTTGADFARLEGHGGPVKGVAISADGSRALTASFDYSVGYWPMQGGDPVWLEGHRAAVNSVVFLDSERAASAGDDFAIQLWDLRAARSIGRLEGHQGKIMALAASTDGKLLASASWDGRIGIWDMLTGLNLYWLSGHGANVNDVVFAEAGRVLYSAGYDGTLRKWNVATGTGLGILARHGFGINELVLNERAGWIAYGALDGGTRVLDLINGTVLADLSADRRPILALALRGDGGQIAVGDGEGYIMVVDTADWSVARDFHATLRGPIWALSYTGEGDRVLAAGIDDAAMLWPLEGELDQQIATAERTFLNDPKTMSNGARQFYRKCSVCHTLTPDGARRAGPSLHEIFGRIAGSLDGYSYSPALREIDIVWGDETISRLFEIGPDHYTPGSKMPMQRIVRPEDRADLIAFLKEMTQ